MLKNARYSIISGITATVVVFVPISSSFAYTTDQVEHFEEEFVLLQIGSQGNDVLELKEALNILGFEVDEEFDIYDEDTEEQVKLLQEYYDFEITGVVDEELFLFILDETIDLVENNPSEEGEELFKEIENLEGNEDQDSLEIEIEENKLSDDMVEQQDENVNVAITTMTTVASVQSDDVLQQGMSDPRVIDLKLKLELVGFKVSDNPNQNYGPLTAQKVREFQEAFELEPTGVAVTVTLKLLDELTSNILYPGMDDHRVVELKEQLAIMGFRVSDNPNGSYGPLTTQKVREFQEAIGFPVTGSADKFTLDRLHELATGPLRKGMYREDVVDLKVKLGNAGFVVPGDTTTWFGPLTESRLMAFQDAHGLTVDGIAGPETLEKLHDVVGMASVASLTSSEVIELKVNLAKLGFPVSDNPNGVYGPRTTEMVRAFQQAYGLPATGNADRATINLLNELTSNILYSGINDRRVITLKEQLAVMGFRVSDNPNGLYGPTTTRKVTEFQQAYGLPATGSADKRTLERLHELATGPLRIGMTRDDVVQLKLDLGKVGFRVPGDTTTWFGPLTESRLKAFQEANGLTPDGVYGTATMNVLKDQVRHVVIASLTSAEVIQLKVNLAKVGFPVSDNPNGIYGPTTTRMVSQFQATYGLHATGVADVMTINLLNELTSDILYPGLSVNRVITLKEQLAIMGFRVSDNPNRNYGPSTTQKVREFQEAYGLPATGAADKFTLERLHELATGPLRKGMYRQDVVDLKINLGRAGFTVPGDTTTWFGPLTESRLKAFQQAHGLTVTGIADSTTLAKLADFASNEIITHMQSSFTMAQSVQRQLALNPPPQTDRYRNAPAYIHSSLADIVERGAITGSSVNLRTSTRLGTSTNIATTVSQGTTFTILREVSGDTFSDSNRWYEISYNGQTLYVHTALASLTQVAVIKSTANVRESASGTSHRFGTASKNSQFVVQRTVTGTTVNGSNDWYEIRYSTWRNAKQSDFVNFLDPDQNDPFQHLVLSSSAGVSASQLNNLLTGKGVLQGLGQAFIDGGRDHSVNEVYLIAHALLETGHGRSGLATGIDVGVNSSGNLELVTSSNRSRLSNIRTTHNMFGINAIDSDPYRQGAFHAYRQGWFTPEAAVIGGAKFIGQRYIHNQYNQNTLYKMRWNPANPGFPQYATDMEWATKQVPAIKNLYNQLDNPTLHFEFIRYR